MSREDVELARRGLEAWSSGDLDAALAFVDPEGEWRTSGLFPGVAPVYQGHEGFKRFWDDFRGLWEEIELVPERLLDHGDRVVVFGRFKARGREGITVEREFGGDLHGPGWAGNANRDIFQRRAGPRSRGAAGSRRRLHGNVTPFHAT
jgi:ketosteroid isomerase-like protein